MIMEKQPLAREAAEGNIFSYFMNPALRETGERIAADFDKKGRADINDVVGSVKERSMREHIWGLLIADSPYGESIERVFADAVKRIKIKWYEERRKSLKKDLIRSQEAGDAGTSERITLEINDLIKIKKALHN